MIAGTPTDLHVAESPGDAKAQSPHYKGCALRSQFSALSHCLRLSLGVSVPLSALGRPSSVGGSGVRSLRMAFRRFQGLGDSFHGFHARAVLPFFDAVDRLRAHARSPGKFHLGQPGRTSPAEELLRKEDAETLGGRSVALGIGRRKLRLSFPGGHLKPLVFAFGEDHVVHLSRRDN